jgi:hypothetical protein
MGGAAALTEQRPPKFRYGSYSLVYGFRKCFGVGFAPDFFPVLAENTCPLPNVFLEKASHIRPISDC